MATNHQIVIWSEKPLGFQQAHQLAIDMIDAHPELSFEVQEFEGE